METRRDSVSKSDKYDIAISECRLGLIDHYYGRLKINGRNLQLTKERRIAAGGFKAVYDIGDNQLLALRNNNDGYSEMTVLQWMSATSYEPERSEKLRKLGLEAQDYQKVEVEIEGHMVPAIIMTHYNALLQNGLQVRGCSASEKYGTSLLFGTLENINEFTLSELFKPLLQDIIILISNKIDLGMDSFDVLVIKNTLNTPPYENDSYGTVLERKQELHFYLGDFFEKQRFFQRSALDIVDAEYNPEQGEIKRVAKFYLLMAHSALCDGVSDYEKNLMGMPNCNVAELIGNVYSLMEGRLLDEICQSVIKKLHEQKVMRFNRNNKKSNLLNKLSIYSSSESSDEESDNEQDVKEVKIALRHSIG